MPNFRRLFAALALLGVAACAPADAAEAGDDGELVVLATFTVIADMASEVAGDRARVESLTKVGAEIHAYEPTASDIVRGLDADLILDNGIGLEAWFAEYLAHIDAPHVTLSEGIETLPIGDAPGGAQNPHAWMSPTNALIYVDAIRDALIDLDPAGAAEYTANAAAYAEQISAVGATLDATLDRLPLNRRVLVTCEGAFSYLVRDAGLREVYLWAVNAESEATPQSVAAAIEAVRESEVPAVFCESTVSAEGMLRVAEESGARFGGTLYVDSLSLPDGPVPTYLALLEHNVATITAGLTGGANG